eukprot:6942093-Alexandrium_andersonii.AAC.1
MTNTAYWHEYDHTLSLHANSDRTKLLPSSLVTFKTKDGRDDFLGMSQSAGIKGMYGTTMYCSKNIAKFQREAGQMLRLAMVVLEDIYGKVKYSDIVWELDMLE